MPAAAVDYPTALRQRIRERRLELGLSYAAAASRSDLHADTIGSIESAASQNVYLDQACALARAYDIHLVDLVTGWAGRDKPRRYQLLNAADLHDAVRRRLRAERGTTGTPTVAAAAGMEQATLVRWESGEYRRLDLIRLERLAVALSASLAEWLTPS